MLSDDLSKRTEYGDNFVQSFIKEDHQKRFLSVSKSMINLFIKYCFEECNDSDRLKCILRPCTEILEENGRRLLDLYIDAGIKKKDLPLFCYSQRQQVFNKILLGKEERRRRNIHSDKKIFLKDFLDILFPKASKPFKRALQRKMTFIDTFTDRLEEMDNFTSHSSHDDYILFSNEKDIFFIDLNREIVTLNPREHNIQDIFELKGFLSFFSQKYDLPVEVMENSFGWHLIRFQGYNPKKKLTDEETTILQNYFLELRKDKAGVFSTFNVSDKVIYINTDIYYQNYERENYFIYNNKKLLVNSLENIVSAINSIQDTIRQKLKGLEEEVEPN